jgi:hypothetical protein
VEIRILSQPSFPRLEIDLLPKDETCDYKADELLLRKQMISYLNSFKEFLRHKPTAGENHTIVNFIGSDLIQLKPKTRSKEHKFGLLTDSSRIIHKEYICDLGTVHSILT